MKRKLQVIEREITFNGRKLGPSRQKFIKGNAESLRYKLRPLDQHDKNH